MAQDVNATPAAKDLAEEHDLDLSSVQGSGEDGKITKPDVEAALEESSSADAASVPEGASAAEEPEELFYAKLNPKLGEFTPKVVIGDRTFLEGEARKDNIVTASEFERYQYTDPTGGFQWLLKGGRAG